MKIELELSEKMVGQLRTVLDNLPLSRYAGLIVAVLPQLPLSAVDPAHDADATVALTPLGAAVGLSLTAHTPKGRERLPDLDRLLSQLPHGADL